MLGWFANILIVVGLVKLGNKLRSGFVWNGVGELLWIGHALQKGLYDLAAICVVFCILAAWNWVKWGRDELAESNGANHQEVPGSNSLRQAAAFQKRDQGQG